MTDTPDNDDVVVFRDSGHVAKYGLDLAQGEEFSMAACSWWCECGELNHISWYPPAPRPVYTCQCGRIT